MAPSLTSGAAGFVHSAVHKIVTGPRFAQAWVRANTVVHQELVKALSGQGSSSVSVRNGQVVVGLGPFIDVVKQDLVKRGFSLVSKIPAINPTLTLFSAKYLVKAQSAYRLINNLKIVLPVLTVLLLALGVFVARGRRRALIGTGLGLAASMLVPAAGLYVFRGIYLGNVPSSVLPADAAGRLVRHARPVHQGGPADGPGGGPGGRRWCVPDRAVRVPRCGSGRRSPQASADCAAAANPPV